MSDEMMFGIAKMPYEMAMGDEMSRRQFYANTQRLAAALEAAREQLDWAVKENDRLLAEGSELTTRAERLAEALRHQRWCRTCAEDGWESCEEGRKNDALLREQEKENEQ